MEENISWILGFLGFGFLGWGIWKWVSSSRAETPSETPETPETPPSAGDSGAIDEGKIEAQMSEINALIDATTAFFVESDGITISPRIIKAIIDIESSWNPYAEGSSGEIGLMQLMPTTAQWLGFTRPLVDLYEPVSNIRYGTKYLVYWRSRGMSEAQMVSCYNLGHLEYAESGKFKNQRYVDKFYKALSKY